MSFSAVLKKALSSACYGFCLLTLIYSLVMIGVYDADANMSVFTVLLFFPLCFVISVVNGLLRNSSLSGFARAIIRYIALLTSCSLFIFLPQKASLNGNSVLLLIFIITIFYIIGSLLYAWIAPSHKKKADKDSAYENVYKTERKK